MYIYIYILSDRNLEPDFGNLPYPEKVPGTTRSDLGKIDKNYDIFTFCETVHREELRTTTKKGSRRAKNDYTLAVFYPKSTRKTS